MNPAWLLAVWLAASCALAQEEQEEPAQAPGEAAGEITNSGATDNDEEAMARAVAQYLSANPDAMLALAARIQRSRIAGVITPNQNEAGAFREIWSWIHKNSLDAAHLAVGFAKDDEEGTRDFETALFSRVERHFRMNPNRYDGIYGRLHDLAGITRSVSKSIGKYKNLDEEGRREHVRSFFEGLAGRGGEKSLDRPEPGGPPPEDSAPVHAGLAAGEIYDRISASNPTGFSAEVMALQSELSRSRPAGAPKLLPTGKLDYPTLRYPFYAFRSAIQRLDASLRSHRAYLQARALRRPLDPPGRAPWDTPEGQRALDAAFGGRDPAAAITRRKDALLKAAQAVARFDEEASKTKDPNKINAPSLRELSALRRDATRWIAIASLEEKRHRLESLRGFMTPELTARIERAPVEPELRKRYRERGNRIESALESAIAGIANAVASLEKSDGGAAGISAALSAAPLQAPQRIQSDIREYTQISKRVPRSPGTDSPARNWLDGWAVRLFPGAPHSQAVRRRNQELEKLRRDFERVAARG